MNLFYETALFNRLIPVYAVGCMSHCISRGCKFESQLGHITFVEIDHVLISVVILPLPLILEWHLSVTGESMYWLTAQENCD